VTPTPIKLWTKVNGEFVEIENCVAIYAGPSHHEILATYSDDPTKAFSARRIGNLPASAMEKLAAV
jgi:hypothetical protein